MQAKRQSSVDMSELPVTERTEEKLSAEDEAALPLAAQWIRDADAIVVCTGAGMGVSSNMGTFRGRSAKVWPPLEGTSLSFEDMSCPDWFELPHTDDVPPHKAAGFGYAFWQARYKQYTTEPPHDGYLLLRKWMELKADAHPFFQGGFSFTSNIDGAWRRAGWPEARLQEVHGSLDYMQCVCNCTPDSRNIWPSRDSEWNMKLSPVTHAVQADQPLPACVNCCKRGRPNVFMFDDGSFDDRRENKQAEAFTSWLKRAREHGANVAVIEIGAGIAIPTVRRTSERVVHTLGPKHASFLRINPEHPQITFGPASSNSESHPRLLSMTSDSLTILRRLDAALGEQQHSKTPNVLHAAMEAGEHTQSS